MNLEEAKSFLLECTAGDARIERACSFEIIFANGVEYKEFVYRDALDELVREHLLVQIPTPGQSRSGVSFRRATPEELSYFHHTVWPVTACY